MRIVGLKCYRMRHHLKSGNSKASNGTRHMHRCSDQKPPFTGLWFEQCGHVKCVLESRPCSGLHVDARWVAAELDKFLEHELVARVSRLKSAEDEPCLRV